MEYHKEVARLRYWQGQSLAVNDTQAAAKYSVAIALLHLQAKNSIGAVGWLIRAFGEAHCFENIVLPSALQIDTSLSYYIDFLGECSSFDEDNYSRAAKCILRFALRNSHGMTIDKSELDKVVIFFENSISNQGQKIYANAILAVCLLIQYAECFEGVSITYSSCDTIESSRADLRNVITKCRSLFWDDRGESILIDDLYVRIHHDCDYSYNLHILINAVIKAPLAHRLAAYAVDKIPSRDVQR